MTTELFDNLLQLLVTMAGCACSGFFYQKNRHQMYFLLTCFYGCYSLGLFYWTVYLLLFENMPQLFYVTEIAWLSALVFLGLMQYTSSSQEERDLWHSTMWIVPLLAAGAIAMYWNYGGGLFTAFHFALGAMLAWRSIQSLRYFVTNRKSVSRWRWFSLAVLIFVIGEAGLWISSLFWMGDSWRNPYFWFDSLLTAVLVTLLPVIKKAVEP